MSELSDMSELVQSLAFSQLVLLCGAVFGVLTAIATGIAVVLEARLGDRRRIFAVPRDEGQLRRELIGTLRFLVMAAFAFAALLRIVPIGEDSTRSVITTFLVCWLGFEIYYWGLHRLMHTPTFYRFHRYHHDSKVTSPLTGYSMSSAESAGWLLGLVGIPLALGVFFTPISLLGLLAYHALYQIAGNVIGHANVDFFPEAAARRAASWISHPTLYHSLHHARFNNHYSFGSSFMDRLLGTEWADWPELHGRVVRGTPLRKLTEQGSGSAKA
jgi:sterol desaturase/sphingolipid hydroxylase (fatty acid hydroxylase superfamily)